MVVKTWIPKNKDYIRILNNLDKHPVTITHPRVSRSFGHCKKIRLINEKKKKIHIKNGVISLTPMIKIEKIGVNKFLFKY